MALIKYIGIHYEAYDRLGTTAYRWDKPGAVVDVKEPENVARFLNHPDVWVEVRPEPEPKPKPSVTVTVDAGGAAPKAAAKTPAKK